jgi:hypothetical protein
MPALSPAVMLIIVLRNCICIMLEKADIMQKDGLTLGHILAKLFCLSEIHTRELAMLFVFLVY